MVLRLRNAVHEGIGYRDVQGGVRAMPIARRQATVSALAR